MRFFGIVFLEKACRANNFFFFCEELAKVWTHIYFSYHDHDLEKRKMALTYLCYSSRLWKLVISVPQPQPCGWWFLPLCFVTTLLSVVLSVVDDRSSCAVLCLEFLGSLWVVHFNLHWQPRSFFFWDDVIIPTLNTQLEDQVLRFACPLPCDLPGLVKSARSISPCLLYLSMESFK